MKVFAAIVLAIAFTCGYGKPQSPFYSYSYSTVVHHGVPYPLAGYRLANQEPVPSTVYTVPRREVETALNDTETTESDQATTESSDIEATTEPESEQIQDASTSDDNQDKEKLTEEVEVVPTKEGIYYIYHPTNGVLQKVAYSARNDEKEMALIAQLKYQNVEPIREPIYTYNPETFVLQPIRFA